MRAAPDVKEVRDEIQVAVAQPALGESTVDTTPLGTAPTDVPQEPHDVGEPTKNELLDKFKIGFTETNFGKFYQIASVQDAQLLSSEGVTRLYRIVFIYNCKPNIANCKVVNKQGYLDTVFGQTGEANKWSLIKIKEEN